MKVIGEKGRKGFIPRRKVAFWVVLSSFGWGWGAVFHALHFPLLPGVLGKT